MTERIRSISASGSGIGVIGAPTLISSTITSPSTIVIAGGGVTANDTDAELPSLLNATAASAHHFHEFGAGGDYHNSIMSSSQISTASIDAPVKGANKHVAAHNLATKTSCRFPKLEECAHFHYECVLLGPLSVRLVDDKSEILNSSIASQSIGGDVPPSSLTGFNAHRSFSPSTCSFFIKVIPSSSDAFLIKRSFDNLQLLDEMLHRCVYDRKISGLKELGLLDFKSEEDVDYAVAKYLERFSEIASNSLTCGTILTWFQLDNKGRRLPLADTDTMKSINTPAVGAAYGVRRYTAQAVDEISIEVGDMISVIDMPSPAESIWWRGKKSHLQKSHYEVGFFPHSCVATIGDKIPRHFPMPAPLVGQLDVSPTKPVLRKHGKLIAFFRSFILSRPSRRRLKQSGIYRERVFSCDLSEHLLNTGQEIPMVLKCCAEFIEDNGIVDGIYRLSGITSNIQKLRRAFDEERVPDLTHPEIRQDIHAVSSLLKMYFRELPNPLCTYQLYDNFVEAIQAKSESNERLRLMKQTVLKLPPPHYRTLKYLAMHLNRISQHAGRTGMTDKNLAIVWAPNLLRSPALESGGVAALRGVGVQAVVTEYLIRNCNLIFDPAEDFYRSGEQRMDSLTDCESLLVEQREHDQSLTFSERPKSLSVGGPKLISLEEAQERHSRLDSFDMNKCMLMPTGMPANIGSYIEVGGGPSSLPDKYHTVLPVPKGLQKRKTASWKSLFTRNTRNSNSNHDIKTLTVSSPVPLEPAPCVTFAETEDDIGKSKHDLQKSSVDLFEYKPMEVCVRSGSIDSLRTAGHSRSVSHDSYFDLLQSPLRGIATTCPSRELSELGLNFDREELEMRIFSESESLLSSPKVGKENIPPRGVLRARPEEFSSTANSVNPSPKKQPRLNLLSPSEVPSSWTPTNDESYCKRYKLEDQLSDIQYIDCSTPEHINASTLYTSVQVHNPPVGSTTKIAENGTPEPGKKATFESIFDSKDKGAENSHIITRYSYPAVQLGAKRKENDAALKERFSYPGTANGVGKYVCRMLTNDVKMNIEEEKKNDVGEQSQARAPHTFKLLDNLKAKNRYSYCEPSEICPAFNFLLRSNSEDLVKGKREIDRSKLSVVTPSSGTQSPRYSLLVGETSSDNSSAIDTPIFDMDPLASMSSSHQDGCTALSEIDDLLPERLVGGGEAAGRRSEFDDAKDFLCVVSDETGCNNHPARDINALKREMSLDLDACNHPTKMSVDLNDMSASPSNKNHLIHIPPSPNTSNFTQTSGNTSQSITPSEFGYQLINRDCSPNRIDSFDNLGLSETEYLTAAGTSKKAGSPLKATISITYKSPSKESPDRTPMSSDYDPVSMADKKPLLETSFDENMVYEQVKFFRNSVTEVNQLLNNGNADFNSDSLCRDKSRDIPEVEEEEHHIVPDLKMDISPNPKDLINLDEPSSDDILMSDNADSLEFSLYENVEMRKPATVYENIDLSSGRKESIELDSLDSKPRRSPSNFSVKQLATKFEVSPVEQQPPFDFSKRQSSTKSNGKAQPLGKSTQITRSLDENAFIREFGQKRLEDITKSAQQIEKIDEGRRKSFDFTRPKSLNPPKRLPGMPHNATEEKKPSLKLKLDLEKVDEAVPPAELIITPTTENRISLIQQNNSESLDDSNSSSNSQPDSMTVLSGVKLDRVRIERIKEERRHQLNEKYRADSFRSKSKTELRDLPPQSESLRVKSKSRGDIRSLPRDNDNVKGSEVMHFSNRIRRISDEKNQNNCDGFGGTDTLTGMGTAGVQKPKPPPVPVKAERKSAVERESLGGAERISAGTKLAINSISATREKISPQFSIRDVTAMFESRAQQQ